MVMFNIMKQLQQFESIKVFISSLRRGLALGTVTICLPAAGCIGPTFTDTFSPCA
ncbi:MAG TPA: hypothetical protein VFJ01_10745 [Oleiagrimonas sp.]|nr:hypothetical protein [Oleiagrimonas sp.]